MIMSSAIKVLVESFRTLKERPVIFLPKLFSTFLSSLMLVWLLEYFPATAPTASLSVAVTPFVFLIVLGFVGVAASLMVASMVKNNEKGNLLGQALTDVSHRSKTLFLTTIAVVVISFLTAFPAVIGVLSYQFTGNILALSGGILLSLTSVLFLSFASYFLPITLLEKDSLTKGFSASLGESRNNSREVTALLLFSLVLLIVAFISTGTLEKLGYVGFIAGRMISATVNTYFFVVSPTYYLESEK